MPTRQTASLPDITQFSVADGNWDDKRGPIQSIVIHTMDGSVEGASGRFNTPGSGVSAQYGVGLDGKLYQWVDEDNVSYGAGNYVVNQTTINIEHEDGGNYNSSRPDVLYESSAKLVADICKFYDFPADHEHIFKHCDVIDKTYFPGGTSCPDSLDVDRIISMANEILNPKPAEQQTPAPTLEQPQTPSVDQTTSNPTTTVETPQPDQPPIQPENPVDQSTDSSSILETVPQPPSAPLWSPRQALLDLLFAIVRLLVKYGVLKEVNE